MTNNLVKRLYEHKTKVVRWFTQKYAIDQLVHYDILNCAEEAIRREKNIKAWKRDWKIRLIEATNPQWRDLHDDIIG